MNRIESKLEVPQDEVKQSETPARLHGKQGEIVLGEFSPSEIDLDAFNVVSFLPSLSNPHIIEDAKTSTNCGTKKGCPSTGRSCRSSGCQNTNTRNPRPTRGSCPTNRPCPSR